jgi:PAS domain S-box-containing protein
MNDRSDTRLVNRCSFITSSAAIVSVVVGVSAMVGWTLHISAVLSWGRGTAMSLSAAAGFVLAGLSLWLLREKDDRSFAWLRNLAGKTGAAILSLAGSLALAEYFFKLDLGTGRLLLLRLLVHQTTPVVMRPIAAAAFLLLGLALLGIDWRTRRGHWPAQFLCLGVAVAPASGLLDLILGPSGSAFALPLPVVVTVSALLAGLVCSRPSWAAGGFLTARSPGAKLLRRVFPAGVVLLCIIAWLIAETTLIEVRFTWVEASVLGLVTCALLVGFIGWVAFIVQRSNAQGSNFEKALHAIQQQLDRLLDHIEEPVTEARLRRRVKVGTAAAVLLTGLMGLLSWRMARQATEDADWVAHTHEVSTALELTLRHLVDVETGGRGFALSGSQDFLEPYNAGRAEVAHDLERLRLLMADSPGQRQRLSIFLQQVEARVKSSDGLVAGRQHSATLPPLEQLERGKQIMDAARLSVDQMEAEEARLLEQRIRHTRVARQFASSIIGLGSLLGVIFLSVAGFTISREIGVSARARAQLASNNAGLEQRVEQRTATLKAEFAAHILTQEELHASEERFLSMVNGIPQLAWMAEADGSGSWYNRRWYEYTGTTFDEMQAKGWQSVQDPRVHLRVMDGWNTAIAIGEPFDMEFPLRGADGLFRTFLSRCMPLRDSSGRIVRWFGTNTDINQRKEGEDRLAAQAAQLVDSSQALEKQTSMLKLVLDSMGEGLMVSDLEGRYFIWNDSATRLLGHDAPGPSTLDYKTFLADGITAVPQDQLPMARTLRGESVQVELLIQRPDGKDGMYIDVSGRPLKDPAGKLFGGVIAFRDISEHKRNSAMLAQQAEELSRQANELLRSQQTLEAQTLMLQSVLTSMAEGLVVADEQGKFILWNPAAEKIIGLGSADLSLAQWRARNLYLPDMVTPLPPGQTPWNVPCAAR